MLALELSTAILTVAMGLQDPCVLSESQKLTASDAHMWTRFGRGVSIDEQIAVIGAEDGVGYVFRNTGGMWIEEARLPGGGVRPFAGQAVATDGERVVLGAPNARGSALVYRFDGQVWILETTLQPADPNDAVFFGSAVAIDGDLLVVGASGHNAPQDETGSAFIFGLEGGAWMQEARLVASDAQPKAGFGNAVSVDGGVVVVGAHNHGHSDLSFPDGIGAAYVFEEIDAEWVQACRLSPFDEIPGERDAFGYSLAMDDGVILVGSNPITTENPLAPAGAAYVFRHLPGDGCLPEARLAPANVRPGDRFGRAVDISGEMAVMGAFGTALGGHCPFPRTCDDGAAYAFRFDGNEWVEEATLLSSDLGEGDLLGWAVAVHDDTAVVSAWRDDDFGSDSGSSYVFELGCGCPADLDGDGDADSDDFFTYLDLFASGDSRADIDGDGAIDSDDFFGYLNLLVVGC